MWSVILIGCFYLQHVYANSYTDNVQCPSGLQPFEAAPARRRLQDHWLATPKGRRLNCYEESCCTNTYEGAYQALNGYGTSAGGEGSTSVGMGGIVAPFSCNLDKKDNWQWGWCGKKIEPSQSGCTVQPHHAFVGGYYKPLVYSDCQNLYYALEQLSMAKIGGYDEEVTINLDNGDSSILKTRIDAANNELQADANFGTVKMVYSASTSHRQGVLLVSTPS